MPPLICGSPLLLDQSFPRDDQELWLVAVTLGEIEQQLENNEINVILSQELAALVEKFTWEDRQNYDQRLVEIYNKLNQWFLQQHDKLIRKDLSGIVDYSPHPIPEGCSDLGLVDFWADEVGRLLALHDDCCPKDAFFIGIACESAYTGGEPNKYSNSEGRRTFPLVGPSDIHNKLIDAYDWDIPADAHSYTVTISDIFANYKLIGGKVIKRPGGGSHYSLSFDKRRPWPVDPNVDPVPDRYLKELSDITDYPVPVLRAILSRGKIPDMTLRI